MKNKEIIKVGGTKPNVRKGKQLEDHLTVSTVELNYTNNGSDDEYPSEDNHPNFIYDVPTFIPFWYEGEIGLVDKSSQVTIPEDQLLHTIRKPAHRDDK